MSSITELLARSRASQADALGSLYAPLYPEIKRVARSRLAQAGGVAGLNTTALVHEGFLRMAELQGLQGGSRGHFFSYAGQVLRSVVIDRLRSQRRDKRGEHQLMVTLSAAGRVPAVHSAATDLIAMDRALVQMRSLDPPVYELLAAGFQQRVGEVLRGHRDDEQQQCHAVDAGQRELRRAPHRHRQRPVDTAQRHAPRSAAATMPAASKPGTA